MPLPETTRAGSAPVWLLLAKELREITGGRALWTLLLLACRLVGYSFFQAVSLYGEASAAAANSPVLATSLSPLDGILGPTFGAFYVTVTLLFPFVAIRVLGEEKQSGPGPAAIPHSHPCRRQARCRIMRVALMCHPDTLGSRLLVDRRWTPVSR